ncbi:hypothetical protein [Winogradskyella sp.]|uniref:hypothetical protein n=1 Tax=Winogradskyella sp. TaxID=1883156 RepID=UPI003BA9522C
MEELQITTDPKVEVVFSNYPDTVRHKMLALRNLVIETAKETDGVKTLEETLKWGEPSFITKIGSTIRMDWKQKSPEQYAMYFQCTSRLMKRLR